MGWDHVMKTKDFGAFSGDVVLFGGIYSNLQAFEAFLALWPSGTPMICTGDIVAYGANPAEVTKIMMDRAIPSIAGNCEKQLAAGADECGCGFDEGSACDLASKGWYPFAAARTSEYRDYYASLPDIASFTAHGKRYAVIHGGAQEVAKFLWPVTPAAVFTEEIATLELALGPIDGVICGHSGVAFERMIDGRSWINAGVIGMPPHDEREQTRYVVLSADGARIKRLSYDATSASDAMTHAGLTQGYEAALLTGIWPSEDVLPPEMRR